MDLANATVLVHQAGMPMQRTWCCAMGPLAFLVLAGAITSGCGSGGSAASVAETTEVTAPVQSGSGAFAVATVPEGWSMYGANAGERASDQEADLRGVLYKSVVNPEDPDLQWEVTSGRISPAEWDGVAGRPGGATEIDVNGHEGYVFDWPRDNGRTGTIVTWLERPDRVVAVSVPSETGLDARALANDVHELSDEAYDACREQCHVAAG
jgi:hypothetical protein